MRIKIVKQKIYKTLILLILFTIFKSSPSKVWAIPDVGAQAYIVIDSDSGRILGARNADKKLPMASTTKIMTAILSIDNTKNLNKIVTIPESCVGIEGSSLYLKPKQHVSVIDLLYGTMLRSGNDAAMSLAYITGNNDPKKFIAMMNDKAKELGAYKTNFINPNGLHNSSHYTTAYDLALISKYAMKNEIFRQIASTKSYKADSLNTILYNKNKVVSQYKYGSGIKIGYTRAAGRCLVASANKNDTEIIVVVLNDNNWFRDSYKVFDWVFENYKSYNIIEKGQYICDDKTGNPVFSDSDFSYLLTEDEKKQIKVEPHMTAPHIVNGKSAVNCGIFNICLGNDIIYTGTLTERNKPDTK